MTINRGPMKTFKDKLLTGKYSDEARDYTVANVFKSDLLDINLLTGPSERIIQAAFYNHLFHGTIEIR